MQKEVTEKYKIQADLPDKFLDSVSQKEINIKSMTLEEADYCFERGSPWLKAVKKKPEVNN